MKFLEASVPVLMYHHIRPGAGFIASTPENFEKQLQWLKNQGYQSLSLTELAEHLAGVRRKRAVVITFDDGYLDNWVYAFPLLQKYGFKATIFLVTSWLNHGGIRPNTATAQSSAELPACPDHAQCEKLITSGHSDEVILRWSEVKAMIDSGLVEFHCHTHTHTRWDLEPNADKNAMFRQELQDSKATLKRELGSCSRHFCWPQGYFDEDYLAIAQSEGFEYFYTTDPFGRNTSHTPKAHIYRFHVRNRGGKDLSKKIRAAHHPLIAPFFNRFKRWKKSL
ncbi:Poly-beta-1,6-N-acetyl-D-glucosamine N-deacetylase [Oligella sp. MSHR50489EDL]|uniref:polysaccharide deacetylase family protein n=1 Tax=Oligella sp. MSHR50489EDL TaxID=3139409 RepID=UPI003D814F82